MTTPISPPGVQLQTQHERLTYLENVCFTHQQIRHDDRHLAIRTWLRATTNANSTEASTQGIQRLNKNVFHANIRSDYDLITNSLRISRSSPEYHAFPTLYGITPDLFQRLNKKKCKNSIIALNYAASILFQEGTTELPSQMAIKRQELVNLLLQSKYLEAEERSLSLYE